MSPNPPEFIPPKVTVEELEDGSVTEAKIAKDAVTEEKIKNEAVAVAKIETDAVSERQSVKPAEASKSNVVLGLKTGEALEGKGEANVLIGEEAGEDITTGSQNVCVGTSAGEHLKTGGLNVFVGCDAGEEATTAEGNVVIGFGAAGSGEVGNFTGKDNVIVGAAASQTITTGSKNVVIGYAGGVNAPTTGSGNIIIGYEVNAVNNGSNKLLIGNNKETNLIQGVMSETAASQELGFFGTAPHAQPEVTGGTVTAKQLAEALALIGLIKVN
ncbi:MAG TPA: hypothetical protein VMT20_07000 [Terriglobia bacterium]|nr:hypothetical protein [Terriglobia bacterium]